MRFEITCTLFTAEVALGNRSDKVSGGSMRQTVSCDKMCPEWRRDEGEFSTDLWRAEPRTRQQAASTATASAPGCPLLARHGHASDRLHLLCLLRQRTAVAAAHHT